MTFADRGQPVEVNVGSCRCPGAPHDPGDVVWLKPEADVPMTLAFNTTWQSLEASALSHDELVADMQAALAGVYLRHAISAWSFVDEKGDAIPIRPAAITRLLPPRNGGLKVADVADGLYTDDLFVPLREAVETAKANLTKAQNRELRRRMKGSSPNGRTATSMSVTNDSGPTPPVPSAPSLPAVTAGKQSTG